MLLLCWGVTQKVERLPYTQQARGSISPAPITARMEERICRYIRGAADAGRGYRQEARANVQSGGTRNTTDTVETRKAGAFTEAKSGRWEDPLHWI